MSERLILTDLRTIPEEWLSAKEETETFIAAPPVHSCLGCFGCWLRTPGACVIKDRAADFAARIAQTNELVIVSRLVYGGYSPEVKAVVDRSLGYLLPYFRIIQKRMHHVPRYPCQIDLNIHFYQEKLLENDFRIKIAEKLVKANALNLNAKNVQTTFHALTQRAEEGTSV